eukprot:c20446_g1_i2 orf=449-1672(+)
MLRTMNRRQEVCRDFQRGSCRFGARCKFSHEVPQRQSNSSVFVNQSHLRAGPNRGGNYYGPLSGTGFTQKQQQPQLSQIQVKEHKCIDPRVCKEQIKEDFQNEHPMFWKLTCYAHWKYLPNDITGDVSFEELRSLAYDDAKQGLSLKDVAQREKMMFSAKNAEFENLLKGPYTGPASAARSFRDSGVSSHSDGSQMLFGKSIPAASLLPSSPFFQAVTSSPQTFSNFRKEASGLSFGFGNMSPVTPASPFAFQKLPQSTFVNVSSGIFGQQGSIQGNNAVNDVNMNSNGGGTKIFPASPFAGSNSPLQSQLFFNNSLFQSSAQSIPSSSLKNNLSHASTWQDSAETMNIENPSEVAMPRTPCSPNQGRSAAFPVQASEQCHLGVDIWLKESWTLGEIPEEEPPVYAR